MPTTEHAHTENATLNKKNHKGDNQTVRLPVSSADVLADGSTKNMSAKKVLKLEQAYGNGDLIRVLAALGIAGPLRVLDPWQLEDPDGIHLIHAGGYAALPFGEGYAPLMGFVRGYLEHPTSLAFPQQSAASWRAALETNLIALLAQHAPSHRDSQVFFSNSGAEAIEAALKFARAARPNARKLINFSKAYHGKTLGALSLTPNEEYQAPFRPLLPDVVTLPYGDFAALEAAIQKNPDDIAAIIIEPIQGEGGVIVPPEGYLAEVGKLAQKHGIIIIADEIQSGLGRTGHAFASLAAGLEPDVITLAKPLGGGLLPVGATLARKSIVQKALGGLASKRHSNTFGGGSLAMAVALKSLELIIEDGLIDRARQLGERGLMRLQTIQQTYPDIISHVRGAGMLFALQFRPLIPPKHLGEYGELAAQFTSGLALRSLHQGGVHACYTLNSSSTLRLTPALNIPDPLFDTLFDRTERAISQHPRSWQLVPQTPLMSLLKLARLALK